MPMSCSEFVFCLPACSDKNGAGGRSGRGMAAEQTGSTGCMILLAPERDIHTSGPSPSLLFSQPDCCKNERFTTDDDVHRQFAAGEESESSIPEYDASCGPRSYSLVGVQFSAAALSDASCESPPAPKETHWSIPPVSLPIMVTQFDLLTQPQFNFGDAATTVDLEMHLQPSPPCPPGCSSSSSSFLTPAPSPCNSNFDVLSHPLLPQLCRSFHDESGLIAARREATACTVTDERGDLDAFMESAVWLVAEQQIRYADFLHALDECTKALGHNFTQQLHHETLFPGAAIPCSNTLDSTAETLTKPPLVPNAASSSCSTQNTSPKVKPTTREANSTKQKTKRSHAKLPQKATDILKKWLFEHANHPYPDEDEKEQLSLLTNLTLTQVSNWFINARRRVLHVNKPAT